MTTEQKRKMLEAAAKACGIYNRISWDNSKNQPLLMSCAKPKDIYTPWGNAAPVVWNPLTNLADCAEMCAELGINSFWFMKKDYIQAYGGKSELLAQAEFKDHDNSRLKAWMYAATMVAAKIGGYEA